MRLLSILSLLALLLVQKSCGQQQYDYEQDYAEDNLYHDYAAKQQEKAVGGGGAGWGKMLIGGGIGWLVGSKYHCRKQKKKLDAKHKEEQKALYQQYYNDVYTLQSQNAELAQALEQYGARMR